mmetsp:Transcript_11695/g.22664  ORF Transcript_11695/g.22664 Transcript_11695/m.22664 type:complete len:204 (-) Transcript_11695:792-1403(-)
MPNMKPVIGSTRTLAATVSHATAASLPPSLMRSLGWRTEGRTAARTIAASTACGIGARSTPAVCAVRAIVVKPHTKPMRGDAAPVIFATIDRLSEPPTGPPPAMPETMHAMPCPASSLLTPQSPDGTISACIEMMARKSTAAKPIAETHADIHPPSCSTVRAQAIVHGHDLTQPNIRACKLQCAVSSLRSSVDCGGLPTMSPA